MGQGSTDGRDSTEPVWDKSENAEVEAGAAGAILITVVLVLLIWLTTRPKPKWKKRKKASSKRQQKISPLVFGNVSERNNPISEKCTDDREIWREPCLFVC
ncbi:MAG: hypothetical protein ACLR23_23220 [Clostridia bacterium]